MSLRSFRLKGAKNELRTLLPRRERLYSTSHHAADPCLANSCETLYRVRSATSIAHLIVSAHSRIRKARTLIRRV